MQLEDNYSSHYGVSQIPAHLLDTIIDTQAPRFHLPAAVGVSAETPRETAA
jgi:hypothetical protein